MEQYLLDIIIVVIMAVAIAIGAYRGLLRALIGVAALLASLLGAGWCAKTFTPPLIAWLQPMMTEKITSALQNGQTADSGGLISRVIDTVGQANWETAGELIDKIGLEKAMELIGEAGRNAIASMMSEMLYPIVHTVLFIVVFVLLRLVLRLVAIPLNLVDRLPVIHGISHLGGGIVGAVSGAIVVSVGLWGCETFTWAAPAAALIKNSLLAPYFAGGAWINYITGLFG